MTDKAFSLAGKAAIVTGAGGGIGRAICVAFSGAGATVACIDLDGAGAAETAAEITAKGGKAISRICDVSSEIDTRAAVDAAANAFGGLHVLVNAAAPREPSGPVTELDPAQWNRVFSVNVTGAFLMSKWAVPHLINAGGGSIIHVASQLGSVGAPGRALYCATKGALIQLAKAMAADHAKQNIRVNTLSPGGTETGRMLSQFGAMEKAREAHGPKHLLGRLGTPQEIGRAALFLASDASSFMTGADLLVDGGYNAV